MKKKRSLDFSSLITEAEKRLSVVFRGFEKTGLLNQEKVLSVFKKARVGCHHFTSTTGYGYNDFGRETLEKVFAGIFGGEAALVRQQIATGTHAIHCCLSGILRPGEEVIFATGMPYDTLRTALGMEGEAAGNLREYGVSARYVPLLSNGLIDLEGIKSKITPQTRIIAFQRSCGYENRPSFGLPELSAVFKELTKMPKKIRPIIFVDNCYGEFVELEEPTTVGADLLAGSLIKNPGGGLAPSGGYIVGRSDLIDRVASRFYAPGLGKEVGPSLVNLRLFYQGIFEAPHRVGEMLKAAALYGQVFKTLGFNVSPEPDGKRADIIQRIDLETPERLIAACQGVQEASPVESYLRPEPSNMPGYSAKVVMAAGTFISGATSELSADAPLKPPFSLYFQGCLNYSHAKLALNYILTGLRDRGLL